MNYNYLMQGSFSISKKNQFLSFKNYMKAYIFLCLCFIKVEAFDCISFEDMQCKCYNDSLDCFGIQKDIFEIEQIISNISVFYSTAKLNSIVLNIENLEFEPNYVFENIKIKHLSMKQNLQNISHNLLKNLSSLISLTLQHNSIKSFGNETFSSLHNLQKLCLDYNNISEIDPHIFLSSKNLEYLSVSSNQLSEINQDFLKNLPSLKTLVLNDNYITSFKNIKSESTMLKTFEFRNNSLLGCLETNTLSGFSALEQVDLSHNYINEIKSYALSALKNLKYLNLSNNVIRSLEEYAFTELLNLTVLDLKNNEISVIKRTAFKKLKQLEVLDLSSNDIHAIICDYTLDMVSLKSIFLQNNSIKSVYPGTFLSSSSLTKLYLEGNTLECTCEISSFAAYVKNSSNRIQNSEDITCKNLNTDASIVNFNFEILNCTSVDLCKNSSEIDYDDDQEEDYEDEEETLTLENDTVLMSTSQSLETTRKDLTASITSSVSINTSSDVTTIEKTPNATIKSIITKTTQNILTDTELPVYTSYSDKNVTESEEIENFTGNVTQSSVKSTEIYKAKSNDQTASITSSVFTNVNPVVTNEQTQSNTLNTKTTKESIIIASTENIVTNTEFSTNTRYSDKNSSKTKNIDNFTGNVTHSSIKSTELYKTESSFSAFTFDPTASFPASIIIKNFTIQNNNLHIKWTLNKTVPYNARCYLSLKNIKGNKNVKHILCPSVPYEELQVQETTEQIKEFCIYTNQVKILKSCKSTTKQIVKNRVDTSILKSNFSFQLPSVTQFTPTDETVKTKLHSSSLKNTEFHHVETTSKIPEFIIPFNITFFDVSVSSSVVTVTWNVNKNESTSVCNLTLMLQSEDIDLEEKFKCENNSGLFNAHNRNGKICLLSFHTIDGNNKICKNSFVSKLEAEASKRKDSGYLNSSLIPLICIFVLVLIIVIVIVLKNIYKKRFESDKYNVYEKENVQKRVSAPKTSLECSVSYSCIAKEQAEL